MKNIHTLPTDKPSRLYLGNNGNFVFGMIQTSIQSRNEDFTNQNIYITSDEEPKAGDYAIATLNGNSEIVQLNQSTCIYYNSKIILTTDQDLIKDGVQAIDDDFLNWFVKNPSCESVKIDHEKVLWEDGSITHYKYEIIIPKEEQKKILVDMMKDDDELGLYDYSWCKGNVVLPKEELRQEDEFCYYSGLPSPAAYSKEEIKLEEVFNDDKKENIKKFIDEINNPSQPNQALKDAAERLSELQEGTYTPQHKITYKHGFEDGAKWQREQYTIEEQHVGHTIDELDKEYIKGFNEGSNYYIERMYSEEDMAESFMACWKANVPEGFECKLSFKEWFEQNKKK